MTLSMNREVVRRLAIGLAVAIVVMAADQASKIAILDAMRPEGVTGAPFTALGSIHVLPVLEFVLAWNSGVSFSLGNTHGDWNALAFTGLAVVVTAMLLGWMAKATNHVLLLALGMVVGGAVGNVIDRLRFGAVVDFLYVHVGAFNWWPAFNIADSAICVGAGLLVFDSLFAGRDSHKNRP